MRDKNSESDEWKCHGYGDILFFVRTLWEFLQELKLLLLGYHNQL
jgi:hypothetical protein